MGYPMAGHLARAGHRVTVYNRTRGEGARNGSAKHGGTSAPTPAAAAQDAEIVLMCVGNDDDVRAVVLGGDGALAAMRAGAILVDHTTASAQVAREVHAAAKAQAASAFSTRRCRAARPAPRTASSRSWSAATPTSFARAEPVLAHYARAVTLMGGPGSGQLTKMVNQICIAGLVQGLAEGIDFAMQGRARRRARARRDQQGRRAVVADGKPRQDDGRRQVRLRLRRRLDAQGPRRSASPRRARNGAALPVTALVDQFYARVQARGGGRWDTSSLIRLLNDPQMRRDASSLARCWRRVRRATQTRACRRSEAPERLAASAPAGRRPPWSTSTSERPNAQARGREVADREEAQLVLVKTIGGPTPRTVVKELPVPFGTTTRLAYLGGHVRLLDIQQDLRPATRCR